MNLKSTLSKQIQQYELMFLTELFRASNSLVQESYDVKRVDHDL